MDAYVAQDLEALADIPNYQRWILARFQPHLRGRVLEIGAGMGTFSEKYLDQVDAAVLLEPASNLSGPLAARFAGVAKVQVLSSLLEAAPLAERTFDAVLLVNVLEHVDDDGAMLRRIQRLLKPGGALLLFVPALPWLFGSLDELVGHRRRYVRDGLRALVTEAGLAVRELRYFDALGVVPWWISGRLLKQRRFSAPVARLYDTVAVPLGARVEALIAPPLGKNLWCVAVRDQ